MAKSGGKKRAVVLSDKDEKKDTVPRIILLWQPSVHVHLSSLANPTEKDSDGLLMVQPINHDTPSTSNKQLDMDHFFFQPVITEENGKTKKDCVCKLCLYVSLISCVHVLIFKQGQQKDCE